MCMMGAPPQRMLWSHCDDSMLFVECIVTEMRHVCHHTAETKRSSVEWKQRVPMIKVEGCEVCWQYDNHHVLRTTKVCCW